MTKRGYKKHRLVIDWFYNSPAGSTVLLKKGNKWIATSAPSFCSLKDEYIINDKYVAIRLALYEGKEVKVYDKEVDYLEPLYNKEPNQMFYYDAKDYRIFDKEEGFLKFEYKPEILKEEEVTSIETCILDIALYNVREMTEDKLREYLANEANPEAGMVYGLTYPEETELVAHVFYDEIFELVRKFYKDDIFIETMSNLINVGRFAWWYFIEQEEFVEKVVQKAEELDLLEEDEKEII